MANELDRLMTITDLSEMLARLLTPCTGGGTAVRAGRQQNRPSCSIPQSSCRGLD